MSASAAPPGNREPTRPPREEQPRETHPWLGAIPFDKLKVGKPHPPLALWDLKHEQAISITHFRGKKVLLIHFAPWSADCREQVPQWYRKLKKHVDDGKLVIIGIAQEQHADHAALFAQWKGLTGPMMHDPVNYLHVDRLPSFVCVDQNGYVRNIKPDLKTIEERFINRKFAGKPAHIPENTEEPPNTVVTRRYANESRMPQDQIIHGEALLISALPPQIDEAIEYYQKAIAEDAKNARAYFGLGVAHCMRFNGEAPQPGDLKAALDAWTRAVELVPKNEVYRERLREHSPIESDQPSPQAWIKTARKSITRRGDTPQPLSADPFAASTPEEKEKPKAEPDSGSDDDKEDRSVGQ